MTPSAFLKVFEPAEALDPEDRAAFRPATREPPVVYAGGGVSLSRALARLATAEHLGEVREVGGRTYICPWRPRLRALYAVVALRRLLPPPALSAIFKPEEAAVAEEELMGRKEVRGHVLQAPFQIPFHWFLCFDPWERRMEPTVLRGGRPAPRYTTALASALERLEKAGGVLKARLPDPEPAARVRELQGWLRGFHPEALVELDYATLVNLMGEEEAGRENSSRDAWEAVEALARGEEERAFFHYRALVERWSRVRWLASSN